MLKAENNCGWALWAAAAVLVGAVTLQAVRIRDVQRGDATTPARPIGLAEAICRLNSPTIEIDSHP